jgi:DinB superfamily
MALQFFLLRYEVLHATTGSQSIDSLFSTLSEAQLRDRPRPDLNSIAWIVWHMARAEDFGVQRFVGHRPQVFDQEAWMARLHVPLRHCGTAMTDEEVSDLSARIDLAALRAYWAAVGRGTLAVVHALPPEALDEVIDAVYVHQVLFDEGVSGPNADFMEPAYQGKSKGWFLAHLGLTHNYEHVAEALVIHGLLGFRRR